ncbi:DNA-binding SARP family transcriptional activator [Marmoricola sp. OAE513]|uniref:AfsR/SARP family transcriptional regulator n=1 Tax=Marmoricola sp. OAE513 TaxID=2817894 RepID=UPI003393DB73
MPGPRARRTRRCAFIAAHGSTGISRARLAELLWPETRDVSNRLSVALSHLRATLDPDKAYGSDHFLRTESGRLVLAADWVEHDVDDFRRAAGSALGRYADGPVAAAEESQAVAALEAAASLYTGEFADGEEADWVLEIREELDALARRVVRALALLHLRRGAADAAVPWLTRLLSADPYDEPDHLALIEALRVAGRYGEARIAHRRYAERMAQLGVPAQPWEALTA